MKSRIQDTLITFSRGTRLLHSRHIERVIAMPPLHVFDFDANLAETTQMTWVYVGAKFAHAGVH